MHLKSVMIQLITRRVHKVPVCCKSPLVLLLLLLQDRQNDRRTRRTDQPGEDGLTHLHNKLLFQGKDHNQRMFCHNFSALLLIYNIYSCTLWGRCTADKFFHRKPFRLSIAIAFDLYFPEIDSESFRNSILFLIFTLHVNCHWALRF